MGQLYFSYNLHGQTVDMELVAEVSGCMDLRAEVFDDSSAVLSTVAEPETPKSPRDNLSSFFSEGKSGNALVGG